MTEDSIHYPALIDNAMRGVVRDVLKRVHSTGLPGEHHFYISYATNYPGVKMSETLKSRYPKEITIVLQHQFWDFRVEETYFNVTLSFNGVPEKLTVPFAALTAFADPSIKFGLQFQQSEIHDAQIVGEDLSFADVESIALLNDTAEKGENGDENNVVSLDAFRNKK